MIGVQSPRFPFGADPEAVAAGLAALGVEFPVAIDAERELWVAYGCEGWPSLFLWSLGGALAWVHFGEGEYLAHRAGDPGRAARDRRPALAARADGAAAARGRPGSRVIAPSAEVFPGGGWERPWMAGEEAEELAVEYEAGGRLGDGRGRGDARGRLDGGAARPFAIAGPGLYLLAEHPRHGAHTVSLRPDPGMRIWSVSFDPGLP